MSDQPEPVVILWGRKHLRHFSIKFCQWSCQRGRSSVVAEDEVPSAAGVRAVWAVRTHWGSSMCGDSIRRGLRSWQGSTGVHNNSAWVLLSCSELTLTLCSSWGVFLACVFLSVKWEWKLLVFVKSGSWWCGYDYFILLLWWLDQFPLVVCAA